MSAIPGLLCIVCVQLEVCNIQSSQAVHYSRAAEIKQMEGQLGFLKVFVMY